MDEFNDKKEDIENSNKIRIDLFLVEKALAATRARAQDMIERGLVFANGIKIEKSNKKISIEDKVEIKENTFFVSRGGDKLKAAVEYFKIEIKDKVCLDVGSSTGGFTDYLLKSGAQKVVAVDVGSNQFDEKLLGENKSRIELFENTDIRNFKSKIKFDLIVVDVSFVSLKVGNIFESIVKNLKDKKSELVLLFKPQFEVGKELIPRDGVVKSKEVRERALEDFKVFLKDYKKIKLAGSIESPVIGRSGNVEYLLYLTF